MDTMIPIMIPINNEPEKCPKCHCDEDIISVCKNCGYEYKDENPTRWYEILIFIAIILFIIWLVFVLCLWLMPLEGNPTLLEVIKGTVIFFASKKIW